MAASAVTKMMPSSFFIDHLQGGGPFRQHLFIAGIHLAMDQTGRVQLPHGQLRIKIGQFPAEVPDGFPVHDHKDQRRCRLVQFLQGTQKAGFHRCGKAGQIHRSGSFLPQLPCFLYVLFLEQ